MAAGAAATRPCRAQRTRLLTPLDGARPDVRSGRATRATRLRRGASVALRRRLDAPSSGLGQLARRNLAESPGVEVLDGLEDLRAAGHDERTITHDRLVERLAAQHQQRRVLQRFQ